MAKFEKRQVQMIISSITVSCKPHYILNALYLKDVKMWLHFTFEKYSGKFSNLV